MQIFVSGGSGFVGGHVIERLVASGHAVHALARSDASAQLVRAYGATAVRGDLDGIEASMLDGCDAVVHCAAFVEEWGTRAQFHRVNVEGTARLLTAARRAGVSRFVFIGTEAAVFDGGDLVGIDERHPYPRRQRYHYSATKAEAERRVLAANVPGFVTLSIRPRLVWGPRDASVLPAVLRMAREGAWVWLSGGGQRTSSTHVANLAHAVELALTRGRGGEAYFVCDDGERTIREFFTALARTAAVELPPRSVPAVIVRAAARVIEGAWRVLGLRRPPPLTRFAIDMLSSTVTIRDDKARRELGYRPIVTVSDGLAALAG